MNQTKMLALLLIGAGLVAWALQGARYITRDKVVDVGIFQVTVEKSTPLPWLPLAGLALVVAGGGLLIFGRRGVTV